MSEPQIAFLDALSFDIRSSHVIAAWNYLEDQVPVDVKEEFTSILLAACSIKEGLLVPGLVMTKPQLVTAEQATEVFGVAITPDKLEDLNKCLYEFGITKPSYIAHFMAQIGHESNGLKWFAELADGSDYEGREDLGNTEAGDGKKYKGVGPIQVTGRDNYEKFSLYIKDPLVMEGWEYVVKHYPFQISGFWWFNNQVNKAIDAGADINRVSTMVNGGNPANGLADRISYYKKAVKVFTTKPMATATAAPKASLFKIKALTDTYLKKEPVDSTELCEDKKKFIKKGTFYDVERLEEVAASGHALVTLGYGAGIWYIYQPHWQVEQPKNSVTAPSNINWTDFNCRVTANLTVGEILQWDSRRRPVNKAEIDEILATADQFQKIRDAWGAPLSVTSFFRPEPFNSQVGGVRGSQHTLGRAMDIYPTTKSLESFYTWISTRWTGGLGDGRNRGFVHLDTRAGGKFVADGRVKPYATWLY